jgi:N-glycosyltransferase StaG
MAEKRARILVTTFPGFGHISPMATVVRRLVERGHEVVWCTGEIACDTARRVGARFETMDFSEDRVREEIFSDDAEPTGSQGFAAAVKEIFVGITTVQMTALMQVLEEFPADVLIGDELSFGVRLVSERTGIPLTCVATTAYSFDSRDAPPFGLGLRPISGPVGRLRDILVREIANRVVFRQARASVAEIRGDLGLPMLGKTPMESVGRLPDLYLMGTVPSFEYPRRDMLPQTHFVGAFLDAGSEEFEPPIWWDDLDGEQPVVHVTTGTISDDNRRLLLPALRAFAEQDLLVIATTSDLSGMPEGELPSNVRLEQYVRHDRLLPRVDVMVTNGGYGGVTAALSHGIPLVVVPAGEEKHEVAAHVAWAGVGVVVKRRAMSEKALRRAVTEVLTTPAYRRRARELQQEFRRYEGPRAAAELIESLIRNPPEPSSANARHKRGELLERFPV